MKIYESNKTMQIIGKQNCILGETQHRQFSEVIQAHAIKSGGKIYTNADGLTLDAYLLGRIHGVQQERARKHRNNMNAK